MNLSLPAVGLFLWLSALTVVAGLPFVQPPSPTWNAQQARCEDALERRRLALEGLLVPPQQNWISTLWNWRVERLETAMTAAQADVSTYCR